MFFISIPLKCVQHYICKNVCICLCRSSILCDCICDSILNRDVREENGLLTHGSQIEAHLGDFVLTNDLHPLYNYNNEQLGWLFSVIP